MTTETQQINRQALAERLEAVRGRIAQACRRAERPPEEVKIIAVTKTFPLETVRAACEVGLRDFGENRARELRDKARALPGAFEGGDLRWHMIGHLQRNKAKHVARHADRFDALDSLRLAEALDDRAAGNNRVLPCLVQVNITGQDRKYGLPPDETHAFLDRLAACEHLEVQGLMAMAAYTEDPETVRPQFRKMRELFETYDARDNPRAEMRVLSMGMSGDFEVAIEEGATQVRLGSVLFGARDYA